MTPAGVCCHGVELFQHRDSDDPLRDLVRVVRPGKLGIDKFWASRFLIGLMEQRRPKYEAAADVTVDTSDLTVEEVCREALQKIEQYHTTK